MHTMTDEQIRNHPEYARVYLHYSQQGAPAEEAAQLAHAHTVQYLAAPPAVAPPKKPMGVTKALIIVVAIIAGIMGVGAVVALTSRNMPDSADDVELTSCEATSSSTFRAGLSVTNSTNSAKDYTIKVEYVDSSGDRVGDGRAHIDDLAPGQTSTEDAVGFRSGAGSTCKIVDITRF